MTSLGLILLFFAVSFLSSSCVTLYDPESSQEWNKKVIETLTPEKQIGQTFISQRPRLNHIQLWLRESNPGATPDAVLWVHLFHAPDDPQPLFSTAIPYTTLGASFPLGLAIDSQDDPAGQSYYLELETNGADLQIYGHPADAYSSGQFFVAGVPKDADMAFRLSYDYGYKSFLADIWLALKNIWLVIPILSALWLPGRLLLDAVESRSSSFDFDAGQRIALAIGLSLAAIPLLLLWTSWLKISLTRSFVVIFFLFLVLLFFWRIYPKRQNFFSRQSIAEYKPDLIFLILIAIFFFTLAVRFIMARDLATPAWVDPVHHATITRLLMENGSYPQSYQPYLDIDRVGYHPGFHAALAVFLWLSGLPLDQGMLIYGQLLNALMVFPVYLFTTSLSRNKVAGLIAALICGVFSPMPAYYTSWGRYTQLAGLVILAAAMALILKSWEDKLKAPWVVLSALACAGLFLVHYRVIAFLAALLISLWIGKSLQAIAQRDFRQWLPPSLGIVLVIALLALLLTSPQLPNLATSKIVQRISPVKSDLPAFADFSWSLLTTAYGRQALFLAALGLLLSLLQARWFGPVLALWVSLLFVMANPMRFNLPGINLVNNTSVLITLFLPISALAGYLSATFFETTGRFVGARWKSFYWSLVFLAGFILAFVGARRILPILNPVTMLSRQADRAAISWISEYIPQDETILISPFLWGYGLYAGQDGGYWITPLGGRKTLPPPVLYGLSAGENIHEVNRICKKVIEIGEDPVQLYNLMEEEGLNYLYNGVKGQVFSVQALEESPLFTLIYHQHDVSIFRREILTAPD